MKKKLNQGSSWLFDDLPKILRIMKLIGVFMFVALVQVSASSYSQTKELTIKGNHLTLEELFEMIENQSEFSFMYNLKQIDLSKEVDVNIKNQTVDKILNRVLEGTGITYTIDNRLIVIHKTNNTELTEKLAENQQQSVSGKVTDSSGSPLPGVTVVVKGTTQGTITDANGEYVLTNIPDDARLQFSFVGMKTQEILVSGKTNINVVMVEDAIGIEEVVAIGYGTQKKKDLTGSISRVRGDEMLRPSTATFDQMLQGKVSGVQITQTTGEPGGNVNILVRGVSSITGSNQPLYVIDGFPISVNDGSSNTYNAGSKTYSASAMANSTTDRINPMNLISPSDIESIEILKDASATAIYGSRGANGVILITTKRGSLGRSQFNVDISYGIQQVANELDMMNAREYAEFVAEARDNTWVYAGGSADDPNDVRTASSRVPESFRNPSSITTNTNWQDVIFQVAPVQDFQLSASGGNEKLKYLFSGGYFHQEGIVMTSDYKRFNIRTNLDAQVHKDIKIGSNISGSYGYGTYPNTAGAYGTGGIIMMALAASPTIPLYDDDGDPYFNDQDVTDGLGWLVNPLTVLNLDNYSDTRNKADVLVNTYLEYKILDGLTFKTTLGINYNSGTIKLWRSSAVPYYTTLNYPSTGSTTKSDNIDWLNENTLSYKHVFHEKHAIDALLGFTEQKATYNRLSAGASDFPTNYITYISAGTVNTGTQYKSESSMISMISRINYSYDGKYLLTATFRRDGSSRFGSKNRYGNFPSFSAGYNISEESFMKDISAISNLKFRVSYGISGNNQIGNYATIGLLGSSNYVENGKVLPGLVPSSLSNDDLSWEKSKQINIGVDLGLFKDRITLTGDIYKNKKTDLLLAVELPAASGYSSSTQNIGDIENKGFELALNTHNIKSKNLNWNSNLTLSANRNKVLKLATKGARIFNSTYQITEVGLPISSFYLLNAVGIFQNEEEIANSPLQNARVQPGDLKFEDVNLSGNITTDDRKVVGNPWPDYIWGFNNVFFYKNLTLGVVINGSHGNDTYLEAGGTIDNSAGVQNQLAIVNNRWRSEDDPGNGITPRAIRNNYAYGYSHSSRWLHDASYIKIKNINLSYRFPHELINKINLSNLTVYADVANVFTFTDYPGYDPELSSTGNAITQSGIDYGTYPLARTYTFGVKISF